MDLKMMMKIKKYKNNIEVETIFSLYCDLMKSLAYHDKAENIQIVGVATEIKEVLFTNDLDKIEEMKFFLLKGVLPIIYEKIEIEEMYQKNRKKIEKKYFDICKKEEKLQQIAPHEKDLKKSFFSRNYFKKG